MASLDLDHLHKAYGGSPIVRDISASIRDGEFIVIVGPSGCGKSTLLRMIAGLETVTSGRIRIDGQDVTDADPAQRGIAMVFQSYALYPHMTVRDNMSFGLRNLKRDKAEIRRHVDEAAQLLRLSDHLDRLPSELSGGQRQRVAIGRAIVREPKIFLFDEPLSNLDAELRVQMRRELSRLHQRLGSTMIYVTHDQTEAMTLADRIVLLDQGRIVQFGTPLELYNEPNCTFAAGFIGSPKINLVEARTEADGDGVLLHSALGQPLRLPAHQLTPARPATVTLGIRPEHLHRAPRPGDLEIRGLVSVVESLGDCCYAYAALDDDAEFALKLEGQHAPRRGEAFQAYVAPNDVLLFDAEGQRIVPTALGR